MKYFLIFSLLVLLSSCTNKVETVDEKSTIEQLNCYFFFISDCPASRNNLPKIQALFHEFSDHVNFSGVVSDPYLDTAELSKTLKEFAISFSILLDTNLNIAREHRAKITPEVFLYNSKNELIYSGSVDNYYYDLGKHRKRISENYLLDAITNGLAGKDATTKRTNPLGCTINFDVK